MDLGFFVSKVFVDVRNGSGSDSSSSLTCDGTSPCWVSVVVSPCGCSRRMLLVAVAQRRTHLVAEPVKLKVGDLLSYHLRYVFSLVLSFLDCIFIR